MMRRCNTRHAAGVLFLATLLTPAGIGDGPGTRIVELEASPRVARLDGRGAYVQVLLTGVRDDGSRIDATRQARLAHACDLVTIDDRGLMRPLRDGEAQLEFEYEGRTTTVAVEVVGQAATPHTSFVRDVMPILARRGCNTGTCHGSANGKNGFKLSLRGYDPSIDHLALTDELAGRRFDRVEPERSLFLLKPTGSVPHQGGRRLTTAEPDYAALQAWVRSGAGFDAQAPRVDRIELLPAKPTIAEPGMSQQFRVIATYSDGDQRDVTAHAFFETNNLEVVTVDERGLATTERRGDAAILARYEGRYAATRLFVMGDRDGFEWRDVPEHNYVDTLVYRRLREIRTLPADLCTDAEFLRRVHLDLTGRPPTPKTVATFLLDARDTATKRNEVIDRLIGSAEFVEHWTNRWADLLQVNSKFLGEEGAVALREWVRGQIASNTPYDVLVRTLLTAGGSTLTNPPAAFYKVLRRPDEVMEATTQLFLGVRFSCNKCHDHPFERWTKSQHWQLAAFFAGVERKDAPGAKKMPESAVLEGQTPPAIEELIGDTDASSVEDADGHTYQPALPYEHTGAIDAAASRRTQVAQWLTAAENPYFARSYVNRLWSYFLGVGLIDPVDDIRASNPPTLPELLDRLTADFVESGFDARQVMRVICRSRVYQHSVETNRWNADDDVHYAHALARRLPAETLFDAVHQATGSKPRLPDQPVGLAAAELVDSSVETRDGFLDLFGRPARESVCECERDNSVSLGQALNLVNGPTIAEAVRDPDNAIAGLVLHEQDDRRVITELYLRFLCRPPTTAEIDDLIGLFDTGDIANASSLSSADHAALQRDLAQWEKRVGVTWQPIELGSLRSDGGAEFARLDDGSVLVRGKTPATDRYTVVATTDLTGITGLRLEVLPDDSLPVKGPGRSENGNFVLARLGVTAVPLDAPSQAVRVTLTAATADFSQQDWPVAQAIVDSPTGWAIMPQSGRRHVAVFETEQNLGGAGGTLLILTMDQPFGTAHTIGRFRWSVTTAERPIRHHGLPDEVAEILAVAEGQRTDQQRAAIYRHYLASDPQTGAKVRLGAAQDLAWALANSSAFLFNR